MCGVLNILTQFNQYDPPPSTLSVIVWCCREQPQGSSPVTLSEGGALREMDGWMLSHSFGSVIHLKSSSCSAGLLGLWSSTNMPLNSV